MVSATSNGGSGVVAAGHQLTAQAGADILTAGGNAYDAAIAAMAMACVCEPILASLGGGGFALTRNGAGRAMSIIDFFPQTPRHRRQTGETGTEQIFTDFGTATQAFLIGPGAAATPGMIKGIHALHGAGASLPLTDLFAPAIAAANRGFPISAFQYFLSTVVRPILNATDGAQALFAPAGQLRDEGSLFTNRDLASALAVLAESGPADNPVTEAMVSAQHHRGNITTEDLVSYEATVRTPLTVKIGANLVHLNPSPAAGGVLVEHSLGQLDSTDPVAIAEAFVTTNNARAAATDDLGLLDPALLRSQGTTHISVIDGDATACSVTVSNGAGNGDVVNGFGFMMNNILGEDDLNPAGPGGWPTNTRLSSMMCPTIIEQPTGAVVALGTGGSNRIRTAITQVVARICLDDADPTQAVEAPRLHVEGHHLDFEDFFDDAVRPALCAQFDDHLAWPEPDLFYGGVHAVRRCANGALSGVGDARRDGVAIVVA